MSADSIYIADDDLASFIDGFGSGDGSGERSRISSGNDSGRSDDGTSTGNEQQRQTGGSGSGKRRRRVRNQFGELVWRDSEAASQNTVLVDASSLTTSTKRGKADKNFGLTKEDIGVSGALICQFVGMATGHSWWNIPANDIADKIGSPLVQIAGTASPAAVKLMKGIASATPYISLLGGAIALLAGPISMELEAKRQNELSTKRGTVRNTTTGGQRAQTGNSEPVYTTGYTGSDSDKGHLNGHVAFDGSTAGLSSTASTVIDPSTGIPFSTD